MVKKSKKIAFIAVMTALTVVFTMISIPLAGGYYNFGDIIIFITAVAMGPVAGALAGGIGGAIGDLCLSYVPYAPFTLVIKASEGLVVGLLFRLFAKKAVAKKDIFDTSDSEQNGGAKKVYIAVAINVVLTFAINVVGGLLMAGGYFVAEGLLLSADKWTGGIVNLPFNVLQGVISAIIASILYYLCGIKKLFDKLYAKR